MEMVAKDEAVITAVTVFRYRSADKFSDMILVKGGQSMDWANPFIHQTAVMIYTLLNLDITTLQRVVAHKPRKIMVFGFMRSPMNPLKICPIP